MESHLHRLTAQLRSANRDVHPAFGPTKVSTEQADRCKASQGCITPQLLIADARQPATVCLSFTPRNYTTVALTMNGE